MGSSEININNPSDTLNTMHEKCTSLVHTQNFVEVEILDVLPAQFEGRRDQATVGSPHIRHHCHLAGDLPLGQVALLALLLDALEYLSDHLRFVTNVGPSDIDVEFLRQILKVLHVRHHQSHHVHAVAVSIHAQVVNQGAQL